MTNPMTSKLKPNEVIDRKCSHVWRDYADTKSDPHVISIKTACVRCGEDFASPKDESND